ncbi:MAG TPA: non-heme iron oxygenase ferredoxin subunit [Longimicrobiales bacterium]|nr:non-heme iron oxygenase ferredoxin subunit [Longimicrobiales bacterium]
MSQWVRVAGEGECPPGQLLAVTAEGEKVVLANVDGDLYALQDRCSHANFPLHDGFLEEKELECLHHGAKFDVCTGAATRLPAIRPVKTYPVEVRDGDVFIQTG